MDHAGFALAEAVAKTLPDPDQSVLIVCGPGYNGGDGLSAARHLHNQNRSVRVFLMTPPEKLRDEPAVFFRIVERLGIPVDVLDPARAAEQTDAAFAKAGVIVDALLGIGSSGPVREPLRTVIQRMNQSRKPVVAADLPSGLDGDSGEIQGEAVRATATVTFGRIKQGCLLKEGPALCGDLTLASIGFPPEALAGVA